MSRHDNRAPDALRPVRIATNTFGYAEGSALIEMGNTKVLCAASIEAGAPPWMRGQGRGWITGEYSLLPRSTATRNRRERQGAGGRTQEIQRLIGRALRAAADMTLLGERTITIDCDVLQADGGTRTAAITGGYVALALALKQLMERGDLERSAEFARHPIDARAQNDGRSYQHHGNVETQFGYRAIDMETERADAENAENGTLANDDFPAIQNVCQELTVHPWHCLEGAPRRFKWVA